MEPFSLINWLYERIPSRNHYFFVAALKALGPESSTTAAAIAYFTLFSLFPLILLTAIIARTWLSPIVDTADLISQLEFVIPNLNLLLETNIQRLITYEGTITTVALITLLWSSSSIFNVLVRTLDRIWPTEEKRSVWRHRGIAIITALLISILLLTASLAHSIIVTVFDVFAPAILRPLNGILAQIVSALASVILFALLYRFLPRAVVHWREIWLGATLAGLLWEFAKRLFFIYFNNVLNQSDLFILLYGSIVAIIAFIAWTYISTIIFLFGAYLNVGHNNAKKAKRTTQKQVSGN